MRRIRTSLFSIKFLGGAGFAFKMCSFAFALALCLSLAGPSQAVPLGGGRALCCVLIGMPLATGAIPTARVLSS